LAPQTLLKRRANNFGEKNKGRIFFGKNNAKYTKVPKFPSEKIKKALKGRKNLLKIFGKKG